MSEDTCVTLWPKWKLKEGTTPETFMSGFDEFYKLVTANEKDSCLHYVFVGPNKDGYFYCREGYKDAAGLLKHLGNVDVPLKKALEIADIIALEVHGPASELEKLKEPLAAFNPDYYPISGSGFRAA